MLNNGMYSSETDLWSTPQDFYDELNREFGFVLDACALPCNAKCKSFLPPRKTVCGRTGQAQHGATRRMGGKLASGCARPASKLNVATRSCAFCQRELTRDGSMTMFWVVLKSGSCAGD